MVTGMLPPYLRTTVWWKTMAKDVHDFCESCHVCATSKPENTGARGLLKTLEVPTRPWQSIGIDFVGPLPESSNRLGAFDMICVIIFSKSLRGEMIAIDRR